MRNRCSWWCCWLLLLFGVLGATSVGGAQERSAKATSDDVAVFKAQTSLVLVDAIVTDKQGKYVRDLSAADFHVWEDGKEQVIKSFSSEANADAARLQYLVMLFDDANSSFDEQARARKAALGFLEAEITGTQFIAIARFENALQVTQNFTRNLERLKNGASGKKALEGTEVAGPAMVGMQGDFHARNLLLALRSLALNLSKLPGRKAVLLFSPGFPLNSGRTYELSAAIDACNRSNVAIYAINVRGLTSLPAGAPASKPTSSLRPHYVPATLTYWANSQPAFLPLALNSSATGSWQVLQAQTGTGGGQTPRPPTRTPGSRPSTSSRKNTRPPRDFRAPRLPPGPRSENLPWFSGTADFDNRQVLHALADGTGGFVFENSNDLLAGVQRIGQEQSHYYILGYTPPESEVGKCHTLKVRAKQDNVAVRARAGYCSAPLVDQLAGTPVRSELEKAAAGEKSQTVDASIGIAYFYKSTNAVRVSVAMEIPPGSIKLTKEKGKMRGSVEVLGTALNGDQSMAARFSDKVLIELEDDKALQQFNSTPYHYEKQFEIASGKYKLKVAFRSGDEAFGRLEAPLTVEAFDTSGFNVSAIAFCTQASRIVDETEMLERELMQDRMSLVSHGVQYVPSGSNRFQKASPVFLYFEIYEPLLMEKTRPRVGVQYVVVDQSTKTVVLDTGLMELDALMEMNKPLIAAGLKLPLESLRPGAYHLELRALDSENRSQIRTAEFEVK